MPRLPVFTSDSHWYGTKEEPKMSHIYLHSRQCEVCENDLTWRQGHLSKWVLRFPLSHVFKRVKEQHWAPAGKERELKARVMHLTVSSWSKTNQTMLSGCVYLLDTCKCQAIPVARMRNMKYEVSDTAWHLSSSGSLLYHKFFSIYFHKLNSVILFNRAYSNRPIGSSQMTLPNEWQDILCKGHEL